MMTVELLPADEHNQRTINLCHPPNWQNPPGGDYDLVGHRRWSSRAGSFGKAKGHLLAEL